MASLRARRVPTASVGASDPAADGDRSSKNKGLQQQRTSMEAAMHWVIALVLMVSFALAVFYVQSIWLPKPLTPEEAGIRGFSEERALSHLKVLTSFGPKPVGSENLEHALEYILRVAENIKSKANPNAYMEIEHFQSKPGTNRLQGGLFHGKSLAYADLSHVLVRLSSKHSDNAEDNSILVSSHVDTVYTSTGGGDCSSCISGMLELVRALSHVAQRFKHSVIFLFNTGEEEGLDGAHSFITQHPWSSSVRTVVDLEAMGAGGKGNLFQAGPDRWLVDMFAKVAQHPSAQIVAQDIFHSGFLKSATDFQVYREVAGLSGLDFAYLENGAVYHTRNDVLDLVRPGSLQHLGDNMLPLLQEVAASSELPSVKSDKKGGHTAKAEVVYFDILGRYMVTYTQKFARMLYTSILVQSLLLFSGSLVRAGGISVTALALAALGVMLTWFFSIASAVAVATLVPLLSTFSVPYIAHPLLAVGLFGAPALFGAVLGHSLGHKMLYKYLLRSRPRHSSQDSQGEAEKFMFKAGFLQWLFVLGLGVWTGAGSSYIPFVWVVAPAIAYGVKESSLSRKQSSRELSFWTLLLALPLPAIVTADTFLRLPATLIGNLVRFDSNPGGVPLWLGNVLIAVMISGIACLSLIYLLPYINRSGAVLWILLTMIVISGLSLTVVSFELLPAFTKVIGKGTYVVHVIDANTEIPSSRSYISVSFTTPGALGKEVQPLVSEGFTCGSTGGPDFVTFRVKKGCTRPVKLDETLWSSRPSLSVVNDDVVHGQRVTSVLLKTQTAHRWFLSVNTNRIRAFKVDIISEEQSGMKTSLVPKGDIEGVDGWHVMQLASGRKGPHEFNIELIWLEHIVADETSNPLLKLRTDLNTLTPDAASTLKSLPDWCVLFVGPGENKGYVLLRGPGCSLYYALTVPELQLGLSRGKGVSPTLYRKLGGQLKKLSPTD